LKPSNSLNISDDMKMRVISAVLLVMCVLCVPVSAISAVIGNEVYLSGVKPPGSDIYLMVTGPNLPSCGAQMDSINTAVQNGVPGSFTIASESSDMGWFYRWDTSLLGGISPGTYRVYSVAQPVDAGHLAGQEYSEVAVALTTPSLYLATPVETMTYVETAPPTPVQTETTPTPTPTATVTATPTASPAPTQTIDFFQVFLYLVGLLITVPMLVHVLRDGKREGRFGAEHYIYAFIIDIFISAFLAGLLYLGLGGAPLPFGVLFVFSPFIITIFIISTNSISTLNKKLETRRERKEREQKEKQEILDMIDEVTREGK